MANRRSKPTTTYTVKFGSNTPIATQDVLAPVFIAPRYALHNETNQNTLLASFTDGVAISNHVWPSRTDSTTKIDLAGSVAKLYTPLIRLTTLSDGAAITTQSPVIYNSLTFVDAVAGAETVLPSGYNLRAGDKLLVKDPDSLKQFTANVLTVSRETVAPVATATIAKSAGALPVAVGTAFTGRVKTTYTVTITAVDTGNHIITARVTAITGDATYNTILNFTAGTPKAIGNFGVTLEFETDELYAVDDVFVVTANTATSGEFKIVTLSAEVPADMRTIPTFDVSVMTKNLVTVAKDNPASGYVALADNYWTATDSAVSVEDTIECVINSVSYPVVSGDIHIFYRELITTDALEIVYASQDGTSAWVGDQHPDNPLGMMYLAGITSGYSNFYLCATDDTTDASYVEALETVAKYEYIYALVPYVQTPAVIASADSLVTYYSQPSIAQFKKLWLFNQLTRYADIYTETASGDPLIATVDTGVVTLTDGDVLAAGVAIDDTVIFQSVYDAETGTYSDITGTVTGISAQKTLTVSGVADITSPVTVIFQRYLSKDEFADAIATAADTINDYRVNYVYCDRYTLGGFTHTSPVFVTAELAAMRGGMAPHAPLTDVTIPGVSFSDTVKFSEAQLDIMNNGGVWIAYNDRAGTPCTRHQLTTGGVSTNAEEDSAVSNSDNIVRTVRVALYTYRGNTNVTQALVDQMYADATKAFSSIKQRTYDAFLGPQFSEYTASIYQNPDDSAGVLGTFTVNIPSPNLNGQFAFNML